MKLFVKLQNKMKLKRILLASLFFDLGLTESCMYQPLINVYFDFKNEFKPIHFHVKYAWSSADYWLPFNDTTKKLFTESGLVEYCEFIIKENFQEYKGKFYMNYKDAFYVSPKGKEIGFVKDFETACKLYNL